MPTKIKHPKSVPNWLVLLTVIVGTFLGRLDQTIVNLALPSIINDFSITVSSAGWIATAYILANAIFVPIWGKLGDMIGRKKVYLMGFGIFILGSVLAWFAWNLGSMIVFRVIQAIAGSADYPTAMAILAVTYTDPKERMKALWIWSSSFAAASVFGPLIGWPLIDHFGWPSVFLINLPVGIIGVLMAWFFIHESKDASRKNAKFDIWGATVLGAALSALVLVLDQWLAWGWLSVNSILCYGVFVLGLWGFVQIEQRHAEPIVDLKFFKNKTFVFSLINNGIIFMGFMGSIFLIPVFAQTFLGYSATESGFLFIPMAIMFMGSAQLWWRLIGKISARTMLVISTGIGTFWTLLFPFFLNLHSSAWDIIIPLMIMAFGMGLWMSQRTGLVSSSVPTNEIGSASSVLALVRNISGAFWIALFTTLFSIVSAKGIASFLSPAWSATALLQTTALQNQMSAYHTVFAVSAGVLFVGTVLAYFVGNTSIDTSKKAFMEE